MKTCPSCGESLPGFNDAFCTFCLEALEDESTKTQDVLTVLSQSPVECPACLSKLTSANTRAPEESRTSAFARGFYTILFALVLYPAFLLVFGGYIGTFVFLACFFHFHRKIRAQETMPIATCPYCNWQARVNEPTPGKD